MTNNPIIKSRWECTTENPELDTPYNFIVTSHNDLSQEPLVQSFDVNLLNVTVPPKFDLKLNHTDISSAEFYFPLDYSANYEHDRYKNNFLVFILTLQSNVGFHSPDQFQYVINSTDGDKFFLKLTDLPYPSYTYNVTLRSKMALSPNDTDLYYSEPVSYIFTTKPALPYRPPRTNMGAFEIIQIGRMEVTIFWEALEEFEYNGPNFRYDFRVFKNNIFISDMSPTRTSESSATFKIHPNTDYRFEIFSKNELGESPRSSEILVSKHVTIRSHAVQPNPIEDVWKVTNDKQANLTWSLGRFEGDFENFTVFWCAPRNRDDYSNCKSSINFEEISKHERWHVFQHNSKVEYNYGISLNFRNYSTGLVWNSCSAREDRKLEIVKYFRAEKPAQKIEVGLRWDTECQFKSIISGYDLTYCLLDHSDNCVDVEPRKEVLGNKLESYKIRGLKPYSRYKFSIGMIRGNEVILYTNVTSETSQSGE